MNLRLQEVSAGRMSALGDGLDRRPANAAPALVGLHPELRDAPAGVSVPNQTKAHNLATCLYKKWLAIRILPVRVQSGVLVFSAVEFEEILR